ncbi:MAG TPA: TrbC/VirB2 family protein [Alphaproteobacteria bacterium]|nr:TrbC/VirB2 family protein [Alphaproteobacteria bacterium]
MKKYSSLLLTMLAIGLVTIEPAFAAPVDNISGVLDRIVNLITGVWGTSLAILAVAFTGIAWAFFGMEPRRAMGVVIGIAIVFGAAQIVAMIQGK